MILFMLKKPIAKPVKKRMVSDEDSHPLPFGLSKKFQPDNCASSTTIKLLVCLYSHLQQHPYFRPVPNSLYLELDLFVKNTA